MRSRRCGRPRLERVRFVSGAVGACQGLIHLGADGDHAPSVRTDDLPWGATHANIGDLGQRHLGSVWKRQSHLVEAGAHHIVETAFSDVEPVIKKIFF